MSKLYGLGTFSQSAGPAWPGIAMDGRVQRLSSLLPGAPGTLEDVFAGWDVWQPRIDQSIPAASLDDWLDEKAVSVHIPYTPKNIFGAGANYRRHVIELIVDSGAGGLEHLNKEERFAFASKEMDERAASGKPFVWVGLPSALSGARDTLTLPYDVREPDWELELAVVLGKAGRRIPAANALDHVAGYTIANDVTARELVSRPDLKALGMDWLACKSAPGFHVLGPYITPSNQVADPQQLKIRLSLNDEVMQNESTSDMIFGVARLIEFVSANAQLLPGDVIFTGSPAGNGTHYNRYLREGDVMVGEIDGLVGQQITPCVLEGRTGT